MNKIITINGLPFVGKKEVAIALAQRLGYPYLETTALYHAAAYALFQQDFFEIDEEGIEAAMSCLSFDIDSSQPIQILYQNKEIEPKALSNMYLTRWVLQLAHEPIIKNKILSLQRSLCQQKTSMVISGVHIDSFLEFQAFCKFVIQSPLVFRAQRYCQHYFIDQTEHNMQQALTEINSIDGKLSFLSAKKIDSQPTYYIQMNNSDIGIAVDGLLQKISELSL